MRVLLVVLTLGGCITPDNSGSYGGWTGPGGRPLSGGCQKDSDCGTLVCARDETCQAASDIHAVHATWTLRGKPADATTCAKAPNLEIQFTSNASDRLGFAPVPCVEGKFTIDKLPIWYNTVSLGLSNGGAGSSSQIDPRTGNAAIDLPL